MLILSVASLLSLFLVLMVFIGFLWTCYIKDHALCENRQFYFFLSNLEDLYFFFMPYWYGLESPGVKVVIFVLFFFFILRGKLLDFTIKYDISTGFLYMPFIKLRNFPSIPSFHCFYHEICWILSNVFFVSIEMILVFVCYFIDVVHYIN